MIEIPLEWWNLLLVFGLPALVGLVRQRFAATWYGTGLLLLLAALAGALSEVIIDAGSDVASFDWKDVAGRTFFLFASAWLVGYPAMKGLKLAGDASIVAAAVPAGVGKVDPVKVASFEEAQAYRAMAARDFQLRKAA